MTLTIIKVDQALWVADVHGAFVQIHPAPDDDTLWQAVAIDWGNLVIAQAPRHRITHTLAGLPKPVLSNLLRHWWLNNRHPLAVPRGQEGSARDPIPLPPALPSVGGSTQGGPDQPDGTPTPPTAPGPTPDCWRDHNERKSIHPTGETTPPRERGQPGSPARRGARPFTP